MADETTVTVWVRQPDGSFRKVKARLLAGDWVAAAQIVEPSK